MSINPQGKTPEDQFEHELSNVFIRWFEESDMNEETMANVAIEVIEKGFATHGRVRM